MKLRIRLAAALLAAALLAGCSLPGAGTAPAASPAPTAAPTPPPTPEPTQTPAVTTNPLTGEETGEDYTNRRPVAVALRSGEGAAPYWGLSAADLVIEGVSEGYDPAMVAVFAKADGLGKIGPVGAARDLGLQFTLPLNAVPVHIGKNGYASNLLNLLAYQDVDGLHTGTAAFQFDADRYAGGYREENCWYTSSDLINAGLAMYETDTAGANMPLFHFAQRKAPETFNATEISIAFSVYTTEQLFYNAETGLYEKNNADGSATTDADNGARVSFKNVFVLYASSGVKDDGYTRQYDLSGGTGLYLTDGAWQEIRWTKGDAAAPLALTTVDGATLDVNPGKTFLAVYGGHYGQSVTVTDAEGAAQTLPERMPLLDSAVSDEAAAAAQQVQDAENALLAALAEQAEAEQAVADAAETEDPADDTAAAERKAAADTAVAEAQAAYDALVPPAEGEEAPPAESGGEEPPAEGGETPPAEEPAAE